MDIKEAITVEFEKILPDKVFPIVAPEGTKTPYMTYELNNADRSFTLNGHGDLISSNYQLDIFDVDFENLMINKKAFINALKGWTQSTLGLTGPYCDSCEITDEVESFDDRTLEYQCTIDFTISYKEE